MIYTVKSGDTVDSIAYEHQISANSIIYNNQIPYPYQLTPGQSLFLSSSVTPLEPALSIYAGEYAYPFISRWVLTQTLPFLTDLYIFSYGFTAEGYLIPPIIDDT